MPSAASWPMRSPHLRRNMASRKGTNSFASPFRNDLPDWHCQIPGRHPGPPDRNTTWASDDAALRARNLGIVGGHLCRPSSIGSPASDSCGRHCHQRIPGERGRGRERERASHDVQACAALELLASQRTSCRLLSFLRGTNRTSSALHDYSLFVCCQVAATDRAALECNQPPKSRPTGMICFKCECH